MKHLILDRSEAANRFPGTARFVCTDCRFYTGNEKKASEHADWIKSQRKKARKERNVRTVETRVNPASD